MFNSPFGSQVHRVTGAIRQGPQLHGAQLPRAAAVQRSEDRAQQRAAAVRTALQIC
jgi:hypothetical protein